MTDEGFCTSVQALSIGAIDWVAKPNDAARGIKEMKEAGAKTVVQDEQTCIVYGMPQEAVS